MNGWDGLMAADKIAVPHDRWEQAIGFANARAVERRHRQRMSRRDVNGRTYWYIRDLMEAARSARPHGSRPIEESA